MCRRKKKRLVILLAGLITCVALGSLCLACTTDEGSQQNPTTTEGDSTMATEETIAANAATVLSYFEEVGFDPAPNSLEGAARGSASSFSCVSDARIKTITSGSYKGRHIDLMVTDENEQDFVLYLTSYGSVEVIRDGDGKMVLGAVE